VPFRIFITDKAEGQIAALAAGPKADRVKHKKVMKCLARIQQDPRHPGLNSHIFHSYSAPADEKVWESYVENNTPGAWRVFWHFGPGEGVITILSITPHP
jgi:hypothetical protein